MGAFEIQPWSVGLTGAVLGAAALITALGLSWSDWKGLGGAVAGAVVAGRRIVGSGRAKATDGVAQWLERREPTLTGEDPADRPRGAKKAPWWRPENRAPRWAARPRRRARGTWISNSTNTACRPSTTSTKRTTRGRRGRSAPMPWNRTPGCWNPCWTTSACAARFSRCGPGPVVTLYEFEPAPGTKTSRVIGLADDIARSMSAVSVRIAVIPGRNVIGLELPNARVEIVRLRELFASQTFERASGQTHAGARQGYRRRAR